MARKMRDSGVEWIGEVPEGWEIVPSGCFFSEVKEKNVEGMFKKQLSFKYGEIVDKTGNEATKEAEEEVATAYRIVTPDTIMINGLNLNYDLISQRVAIVKETGIITSAYLAVKGSEKMFPKFSVYLFKGYDSKQVFHSYGSGIRKTLKYSDFKDIPSIVPPLPEQRRIAEYLDEKCAAIDGAVDELKRSIEDCKAWKKAIIFEAVTGKANVLAASACAKATADKKSAKVAKRQMRDSGIPWIGEIPEGWEICKALYALSMPITDGPHTTPELFDHGVPFVSAEAVSCGNGSIDFAHIRGYISEVFYQECCQKYIPHRDDIFMIKSGATTGRVAIVDTDERFTIWSPLAVFRVKPEKALPKYFFYMLQSPVYQKQVELGWSYGTQQNIGMRALEQLKILMPPLPEQQAIADYLDEKCAAIDALVAEKEKLIADLEAYKKSLIFELVTGKREVA